MNFYDFKYRDSKQNEIDFKNYFGKIVLIVNTAIHDTFSLDYKRMEKCYRKYKEYDFEILDFPCDQFHGMTPEDDEEISKILKEEYDVTFTRFLKCEVKGENKIELYDFLTKKRGFKGMDITHPMTKVINSYNIKNGIISNKNSEIRWNFTKFLVDRYGNVVKRFEPTTDFEMIEKEIKKLINTQPQFEIDTNTGLMKEKI